MKSVTVIGGGLSGVEAAYQIAKRGIGVRLYDIKPDNLTEGHKMKTLGEMICSNSLGSNELTSGAGLIKRELEILDSFFLKNAERAKVSAGNSFSVDREVLSSLLTEEIKKNKNIDFTSNEIKAIPKKESVTIIATGPLTTEKFSEAISGLTGRKNLFFYDATSPIIDIDSIDMSRVFWGSRYEKGEPDFINIPLNKEEYYTFIDDLNAAEKVELKDFEDNQYFEACLPIEEIASRGRESASFGPLKPVGFIDPNTGKRPYAIVQLRQDDVKKRFFQMVGFQTRLKWGEQKRVFRTLPGLANAKFERYGRMHRNSYVNAPVILNEFYQMKKYPNIFFAGQISGVEGYLESVNSGLIAGIFAYKYLMGENLSKLPEATASGSLLGYITGGNWKNFKPSKFTFGLLSDLDIRERNKKKRKELKAERALAKIEEWKLSEKI